MQPQKLLQQNASNLEKPLHQKRKKEKETVTK